MRPRIFELKSRHARHSRTAGGKGSGLARLHQLGYDVPRGFVIGTSVFDSTVRALGIRSDLIQPLDNPETLDQLRISLARSAIRPDLRKQILSAYRRLDNRVAVRSSLVGEDGARTSLAGQLETVLNIENEDRLLDAIRQCYTSVYSIRLHRYLINMKERSRRFDGKRFSLALIVQEMVPAAAAGVAFSADPETGERCVIIEAAGKDVEAVADGTIEPARWVVDARGVLVESRGELNGDAAVSDAEVLKLAGLVRAIAAKLGEPQDIEWAWDGERFWFLQTRPITTLVGKKVYSKRLVADMSPGLVKPLLWSTNTMSMAQNVFGRIFTELIGPNEIDFRRLNKRIHSRIYANMTMLGELLETIGLPANFFEMMARDETGERPAFKPSPFYLLQHGRLLRFLWKYSRSKKTIEAYVKSQHQELEPYRRAEWKASSVRDLMHHLEDLMKLHGRSQWHVFLAALNMMMRKRLMDRFLASLSSEVCASDLLIGLEKISSRGPDARLKDIARAVRELGDGALQQMRNEDDVAVRAHLRQSAGGRKLIRQVDEFLKEFGFLSSDGTDFTAASWVECPDLVWKSVARTAGQLPRDPTGPSSKGNGDAENFIRKTVGPVRCIWFKRLWRSTLDFMALREQASLLLSEDAYQMRRVLLAIDDKLRERRLLEQTEDIFFLYIEELHKLVGNKMSGKEARRIVKNRREELTADARIEPLDTVCDNAIPSYLTLRSNDRGCLMGIGGSSGITEGRAIIIRDPLEAPSNVTKQDILVVPFTDVGWTPLFAGVGGIVAETGGQLSHTSIIAREYNLPAVVSVRNATHLLQNGQAITIDGRTGRVHLGHILTNGGNE